jgi:acylphosphatase
MIEAEGELDKLLEFVSWCRRGPESCTIESFEVTEMPLEHSVEFSVVHGIVSSGTLTEMFSLRN